MIRLAVGLALLAAVALMLAGCTRVVIVQVPEAGIAPPLRTPPPPGRNPCEVVICGLHPSRIV